MWPLLPGALLAVWTRRRVASGGARRKRCSRLTWCSTCCVGRRRAVHNLGSGRRCCRCSTAPAAHRRPMSRPCAPVASGARVRACFAGNPAFLLDHRGRGPPRVAHPSLFSTRLRSVFWHGVEHGELFSKAPFLVARPFSHAECGTMAPVVGAVVFVLRRCLATRCAAFLAFPIASLPAYLSVPPIFHVSVLQDHPGRGAIMWSA